MLDAPRAGTASVAAQLLDFYREPVVHRSRYLHGQVPMPPGREVFKLALGRFPHGWQRDLPARQREETSRAAHAFVRQVCLWEHATHYQVLCVPHEAGSAVIRENYRLLIALIHPDRKDASGEAWPTDCAQRVNQAYATLADAQQRAAYDEGLHKAGMSAVLEAARRTPRSDAPRARPRGHLGFAGLAGRTAIVLGVIATLFVVQGWWFIELPRGNSLLERAYPLQASARWMREALPGSDTPRFLGVAPLALDPVAAFEPVKEPQRLVALASGMPMHDGPRVQAASAPQIAPAPMAPPMAVAPVVGDTSTRTPAPRPAAPEARVPAPAEAPLRLTQLSSPASPAPGAPTSEQVETLVALLVGSYDAGDAERIMGLLDGDELGFWKGWRTRGAYADFFGATKARRLRMNRLDWRNNGATAQVRGEATILAEYQDGRPRLERNVPVELDIAIRGAQPRITRLVLFPGGQ